MELVIVRTEVIKIKQYALSVKKTIQMLKSMIHSVLVAQKEEFTIYIQTKEYFG
jgi:hypothetical protein